LPEIRPLPYGQIVIAHADAYGAAFESCDDIVDHCCYAWNTLVDQPWKIMSIARRKWAVIGQSL